MSESPAKLAKIQNDDEEEAVDMFADKCPQQIRTSLSGMASKGSKREVLEDADGYMVIHPGDFIEATSRKFHISGLLGKGMYGTVYKATVCEANDESKQVALKIHRNNSLVRQAGIREYEILQKIRETEKTHEQGRFIIRILDKFDVKNHLGLSYELLEMNARDLLEKYGEKVGLSLKAIQIYCRQICAALAILRRCKIIHADLKPDNILISSTLNVSKLCDFGTAIYSPCTEFVPYLASRYYRAPEVILGTAFGCEIDIWSLGCTLFELYTGKVLFPGHSNNEMLRLMMNTLGKVPSKMIKSAKSKVYFDQSKNNALLYIDSSSRGSLSPLKSIVVPAGPTKSLRSLLLGFDSENNNSQVDSFVDFLQNCLVMLPEKRLTPTAALTHPFLKF